MTQVEIDPSPIVRLRGIVKRFAGVTVVDGVDLDLFPGQVHVLAGENGAGKSTLMKVLAGIHQPDGGTIEVEGEERRFDVAGAKEAGIAIVHQELLIAPNLSVADNLAMGREYRGRFGGLSLKRTREAAKQQLDRVGVDFPASTRAGSLSTGKQQLVEIARAISDDPKVLIFDEPTAALSTREVRTLFRIVRELRERGCAIVYITHRMDEIEELADAVTVLRDGRFVATMPKAEATPDAIVTKMVGRSVESLFPDRTATLGDVRLSVRDLGDGDWIGPIGFDVRAGEIVGVAGLVGSGRSEMARLIFGADRAATGTVSVDGQRAAVSKSPIGAMRNGIALVPESRKEQGLVLGRGVSDNIVMASYGKVSRGGVIQRRAVRATAEEQKRSLGIRVANLDQRVRELSGGNQQKVLLSKWLETDPKVLILDEPTRGVDVGAKADIYKIIEAAAQRGTAVLVISSELPEVLGLADRVLVMRQGDVVADLPNEGLTEEAVMEHAFGLAQQPTTDIRKEASA
ncbi:sugar ABC transporter ATP-binding protein [Leucobacter ruminantium]|uniref:Sugar ABC transporter ATP-binding protein n=1 Tax=Leucobacter ruminantium TaxID=1289170 RepID=A0A939LUH5_9MICO|nr:sugar ABC transporter ATP-binding protein [Leucobacter ruminantium]MBO1805049.1 sugar ABC transporter ATP-binding protein [Leucobacter ruminantium]